jgi:hypothetical protein
MPPGDEADTAALGERLSGDGPEYIFSVTLQNLAGSGLTIPVPGGRAIPVPRPIPVR